MKPRAPGWGDIHWGASLFTGIDANSQDAKIGFAGFTALTSLIVLLRQKGNVLPFEFLLTPPRTYRVHNQASCASFRFYSALGKMKTRLQSCGLFVRINLQTSNIVWPDRIVWQIKVMNDQATAACGAASSCWRPGGIDAGAVGGTRRAERASRKQAVE